MPAFYFVDRESWSQHSAGAQQDNWAGEFIKQAQQSLTGLFTAEPAKGVNPTGVAPHVSAPGRTARAA